ncbi:MAG: hypothetical protein K2W94_00900 [Alphaproteobacteria bacterium]|nr:hypothetical protein [Alphaproteobacteria bacterium]
MKKIIYSLVLSLTLSLATTGFSSAESCDDNTAALQPKKFDGLEIAQKYIDYLKEVGTSADGGFMNSPHPFAAKCKKIINGKLVLETDQDFRNQLKDLTKASNGWEVELADKIAGDDGRTCVVRYYLTSKTLGKFTTIAILRFDNSGALKKVNEVYHTMA